MGKPNTFIGPWRANAIRSIAAIPLIASAVFAAPPDLPAAIATTQPAAEHQEQDGSRPPPVGLLTPIPETGMVPPIVGMLGATPGDDLRQRAEVRGYARQIRQLRQKYLGDMKNPKMRLEGIAQIVEFTDPAAFLPLIEELREEKDDVRLALLDHFAKCGDEGQGALAYMSITDRDAAIRNEATTRLTLPPAPPVLRVIDMALRSRKDFEANMGGQLAGNLQVLNSIPLLIMAQVAPPVPGEGQGDVAWIAIETQRSYVAGLTPVVGDASGAFEPQVGVVTEGSVLRIHDAVAVAYRTEVHNVLVGMTTNDWGQPTEHLGYNIDAWWHWYNEQYLPYKNAQTAGTDAAAQVKSPPTTSPSNPN
jgi:hypothetical protein